MSAKTKIAPDADPRIVAHNRAHPRRNIIIFIRPSSFGENSSETISGALCIMLPDRARAHAPRTRPHAHTRPPA